MRAADGDHFKHTTIYLGFAKIAKEEAFGDIARLFKAIIKVEVVHEAEYLSLKAALEA